MGYPESNNTWEPIKNIQAPLLIKQYHRHHSSASSSDNNLPGLIAVEERLPTFTEAAATVLQHTHITTTEDPPLFHLSLAMQEANQEYPPISPRTAEVMLRTHPDINNTIGAVAFRLIATIHRRTLATSNETEQGRIREAQLQTQLATHNVEVAQCNLEIGHLNG